ncbi:MAG TPA: tetrahydrofolate dehydrogenase/cyclohydrolase catalytic domain-containing protein, partial [Pyrinomonadaceae bacterium]|nr:tetrahydrofolate dehydrogenase/cyclohydrolase catalytic domain-containing protein [Pyrinomonadaceae bacterium]
MSKTELDNKGGRALPLDGGPVADAIKREAAEEAARLREAGVVPCLATVLVGDDAASAVYVRNKVRACEELGLRSERHDLPAETTTEELLALVSSLNARDEVDGILVQLPLPRGVDEARV